MQLFLRPDRHAALIVCCGVRQAVLPIVGIGPPGRSHSLAQIGMHQCKHAALTFRFPASKLDWACFLLDSMTCYGSLSAHFPQYWQTQLHEATTCWGGGVISGRLPNPARQSQFVHGRWASKLRISMPCGLRCTNCHRTDGKRGVHCAAHGPGLAQLGWAS